MKTRGRDYPASFVILSDTKSRLNRILPVELPYILPEDEPRYIQLAADNPDMLCSEAPPEILQASSFSGDEPTAFLFDFFATGYNQWHQKTHGFRVDFDPERVARGVLLLWFRACDLYTSLQYERPHPDWQREFFSDEGL